jgi:hypothetical protein
VTTKTGSSGFAIAAHVAHLNFQRRSFKIGTKAETFPPLGRSAAERKKRDFRDQGHDEKLLLLMCRRK